VRIISHRGNFSGPKPKWENTIENIEGVLAQGYSVEYDIWRHQDSYWLGHDGPVYNIQLEQLLTLAKKHTGNHYIHCKNIETAQYLTMDIPQSQYNLYPFMHNDDSAVLLKNNILWVHPRNYKESIHNPGNTIIVMPDLRDFSIIPKDTLIKFAGVCTDYPFTLRAALK
jgi:hypothetical protein